MSARNWLTSVNQATDKDVTHRPEQEFTLHRQIWARNYYVSEAARVVGDLQQNLDTARRMLTDFASPVAQNVDDDDPAPPAEWSSSVGAQLACLAAQSVLSMLDEYRDDLKAVLAELSDCLPPGEAAVRNEGGAEAAN